jgi:hypothetical protein
MTELQRRHIADSRMTTAEKIEGMTDAGQYEILATRVLRDLDADCRALVHAGVNAQGKTIANPIDAFCLVPGSNPPRYVMAGFTLTTPEGIIRKWLFDHTMSGSSRKRNISPPSAADDGDLVKAGRVAATIRANDPNAKFVVWLCTNRRLDNSLQQQVYDKAAELGVEVRLLEQSQLRDFLDATPDGQWLRQEHLGVKAERLSTGLLHELGRRSLDLYRRDVVLLDRNPLVLRGLIEDIVASARPGGSRVCLVVGQSGYGKSVAAAEALDRHLSTGALGLWLPARFLREAANLESAIDAWLRSLHPSLGLGAGQSAADLARKLDGRLLVCIDDINRTPEAANLLRFAVNHAAPPKSAPGQAGVSSASGTPADSLCQVIPIWPAQLSSLVPRTLEQPWVHTIAVGEFQPDECSEMIQGKVPWLSSVEARDLATRLNHDPFLVGLFTVMADQHMNALQLRAVADDAIGHFVNARARDICSMGRVDLLPAELLLILVDTSRTMLHDRNLRPSWAQLVGCFGDGSKTVRGMRLLIQQGHVCRLDLEDRLEFRHERLQERFLVQAIGHMLELPELPEPVVSDPYYSEVVGKALAQADLPIERLARLRTCAPWTFFEAIRQAGEPSSQHQVRLFEEARNWATNESKNAPESMLSAICWALIETDSSAVLSIVDAMKPNALLMAAGLRNGSAEHGMRFLRAAVRRDFEPGRGDGLRDRIVEQARHRHGENIAQQIREHLSNPNLAPLEAKSYLALLGHFRFAGFDELILNAFARHRDDVLAYAIWAAARCPLNNTQDVLGPLLERLAILPVRRDHTKNLSQREWDTLHLGWSFHRGVTPEAVSYLLQAVERHGLPPEDVSLMIEGVDNADAVEFVVRHLADGGGSNLWSGSTGIGDGEPQVRSRSPETVSRLSSLWQSDNEPASVRTKAFCLWLQATGSKDSTYLASIKPDSPFYRFAVQHRIKLADRSVIPALLDLLRSDDMHGWWWMLAHRVWSDELSLLASEAIAGFRDHIPVDFSGGQFNGAYHFAQLLVEIPVKDAEDLLRQHWSHLKASPPMIHSALRIGTPACMELVTEAVSICPAGVDVFAHAFSSVWETRNAANPISLRHLQNLEPYLELMGRDEILFLAWETERAVGGDHGIADWIRQHLIPRLPAEDQIRIQVADEMLVATLDRNFQETQRTPYLGFLFDERGGHRFIFQERQIRLLDEWLSVHRSVRGLEVAVECLKHIGTRRNLDLLDRYHIEGDASAIGRLKADARFSVCKRTLT